jgi:hypothetical protein
MVRTLGAALPPDLLEALSQSDLSSRLHRALPLVTLDAESRPHPMLCSYIEVLALDPATIRVAIAAGGRSARNLEQRRAATLILVDPERTVYVKCRATGVPLTVGTLERFVLTVEEVLEDTADPSEGPVRITSGIAYGPAPSLDDPRVRFTLDALRRA